METETESINAKLTKLVRDVELIKEILLVEKEEMKEIELTDWAKKELEAARRRKTKISHEEVKRRIFSK